MSLQKLGYGICIYFLTCLGVFSVLVIEARNLPAPALIPQVGGHRRPPDTWVVCEYGSSSQRTFPRRGTLTPQWNSTLAFTVDANSVQTTVSNRDNSPATDGMQPGILQGPDLIVSLKSSDPTDPHQASPVVVGSVTIQPREIVTPSQGAEGWFKLVPPDKRSATNFKTEVYLMFKPHLLRPLSSLVLTLSIRNLSAQLFNLSSLAAEHVSSI